MLRRINWSLLISGMTVTVLVGAILTKHYWPKRIVGGERKFFEDKITKFCINKICINQENGKWLVETGQIKIPANQEIVDIYQKRLAEIELSEIISNNESRFAELGIGGTNLVIIEIGNKKLEVGNITYTTSGSYVREPGAKVAYRIPIILEGGNLASLGYWQNKKVTNLPIYQIKKIVIDNGKKSKVTEAKDGKWENQKLVDKVAYLLAVKFLPDFKEQGKRMSITITTEGGETKLTLGRMKDGKRWLYWATTDNNWYYEIAGTDYFELTGEK